ncbi:hypothetical protein [Salibaculum sp.]|uniref:hypothetical protein n=1 Tax=Salibaculum sp. TaxID=2855480 RepID=UPI002B486E66|nr:hypothetical protein [Salibaculum sp.]HKL70049.1 hypothetical protein [Salibaculum sp.]
MTDQLAIPAAGVRSVWVFTADLPEADLEEFRGADDAPGTDRDSRLEQAVGAGRLAPSHVELFMAETMADYGLSDYLVEANGMDASSVDPDRARLDALRGPVLLVLSGALADGIDRLEPKAPLTLVGRYTETPNFTLRPPLQSVAAPGSIADAPPVKRPSDAAMSGRIAALALLVLFLVVGMMIWVGA